ncbi:MAG: sirohydrochlorin cobaltochelatase [Lachnospiraceae bacterium]|nr:sirohydrochlorin cobaltochelatase [Lachnospiraceae bacterium]
MKMRTWKKLMAGTVVSLFACGMVLTAFADEAATEEEIVREDDEEDYTTGDASLDNPRNQDEIGEKELLVVSFGTSFNDSRRNTIGAIENTLEEAFPEWSVRRAFTSQIIIDHVEKRDGIHIDNVEEALERAIDNGVKTLLVQPTHLMTGYEYLELEEKLAGYADAFENIGLGTNLLDTDEDFEAVAQAITAETASYDDGETAIVFMGHGTEADSNGVYAKMQDILSAGGFENYYIGTVEAVPSLDDVIAAIADKGYTKVVLEPLMVVAGDHANNDMAAEDDPESWYSILTAEGYDVTCVLKGLGEIPAVREIYAAHTKALIESAMQQ